MVIGPGGPIQGPGPVNKGNIKPLSGPKADPSPKTDKVEISSDARDKEIHASLVNKIKSLGDIRQDNVNKLRQDIEAGKFESEERLREAVQNFLNENRDLF